MTAGHERLEKIFKKLAENKRLSHSYIFFGEPQVGKRSFAVSLATFLEKGDFDASDTLLTETLLITPDEKGAIGIDAIRGLKHFLSQKPVNSPKRVAIVDDAETLTPHAQNAILKISEEPSPSSLIILVVPNPDILLDTLRSRFQKIYFPRFREQDIARILTDAYGAKKAEAERLAKLSLGRPGRAVELFTDGDARESYRRTHDLVAKKADKADVIARLVDNPEEIKAFFTHLVAELSREPVKNCGTLKNVMMRIARISQFTTNKRLQLEAALWNI